MTLLGLDGDDGHRTSGPPRWYRPRRSRPVSEPVFFFAAVDLAGVLVSLCCLIVPALMAWGSRYGPLQPMPTTAPARSRAVARVSARRGLSAAIRARDVREVAGLGNFAI